MGLLMVLVIVSRLAVAADATTNDSDLLRTSHLSRLAEWVHKDYRMQKHFQTLLREPHFLQPDGEKSGLVGAYFANMNFEGTPAFTRVDREVRFSWGDDAPREGFPSDTFSVRWTGKIKPKQDGDYVFYLCSDDGSRLYVDGKLLVDNWGNHGPQLRDGTLTLKGGQSYDLQIDYYDKSWNAVAQMAWGPAAPCPWQVDGGGIVSSLDAGSIDTLLDVPESGSYRVSLRHQIGVQEAVPVTLDLRPQKALESEPQAGAAASLTRYVDAGRGLEHTYGKTPLPGGKTGREIEEQLPIRFEHEAELSAAHATHAMVWEHWDVELKKGVYRATLAAQKKGVRAHSLFLSRSKEFRPSVGDLRRNPSLGRIYTRFRVTSKGESKGTPVTVKAGGWNVGQAPATPEGKWTPFIEATNAIMPRPGAWSSCPLDVAGVTNGELEVQFSWHPGGDAESVTVKTGLGGGRALLRVPHGDWTASARAGVPAWGMWSDKPVREILTQEAVLDKYFTWAKAAEEKLKLKPDHPRTKAIRLYTGNGVLPANRDRASEMLARLGINWIEDVSPEIARRYGLSDEHVAYNTRDADGLAASRSEATRAKLTRVKVGDEISTYTAHSVVNGNAAKLEAFRAYLAEQAAVNGAKPEAFFDVRDPKELTCIDRLPEKPSLFDRRLFYHSQRFCHLTSADDYREVVRGFEQHFPNVRVYNNYSPHPVFLTGETMNHSDWFVLCRNRAQTLAWAEDWAFLGDWSLNTAYECTSFYAALVECAARKHGYPAGFYVNSNCGGSGQKIFGCLAAGVTWLHLYDWGPLDVWADGSNSWSDSNPMEYFSILCATATLGPADEIIGKGRREPRRTAILYNRSHEIVNGGRGRLNHDWMWTFIALKHARIPVEVIIEEDLNPEDLKRYDVVFAGGINLERRHVTALKRWVEDGGLLIGTGGAGCWNVYGEPQPLSAELFGARQLEAGADKQASLRRVRTPASDWYPAGEYQSSADLAFILEPTTAKPLGTYGGGECAATINAVGKGHAILLGFRPGWVFSHNAQSYAGGVREWLAAPLLKRLGRQRVEFDYGPVEATLFEHDSGLAVTLAHFGLYAQYGGGWASPFDVRLSVQTDRPIREVSSVRRGPLEWKREGDRIEIKGPRLEPVDVVILK
jgi:hypothetical protein